MSGYVPGEQPQSGKFIKLNTNENPYPPSTAAVRGIQDAIESGLARYPDPMADAFRTRAAEILGVSKDWILCGNGSDDILTIVTRAMVGPGEVIRSPYPSYVLYHTLAEIQGARIDQVQFARDWSLTDQFSSPVGALKLAFLANPNSPSGTVVEPDSVLRLARKLPCPLLVDEAYADFAEVNCLSLVAQCEKIMVARSMSKSYALAGLRFGYIVAQPQIIEQLAKVKDSYNCDSLAMAGATAAIDDQQWQDQNRSRIVATRKRLTEAMCQLGFSVQSSQANFVWCTRNDKPVEPVYMELKRSRVLVRYMNYPGWGDGLRVSVGTDEQIDALLGLLEGIVG